MTKGDEMTTETRIPRLSPSTAHVLLTESPLHAWQDHWLLGGGRDKEETEGQSRGKILDRLLFGVGPEIVPIDAPDFRTKAAQEAKKAALEARKLPVIADKLAEYDEAIAAIRAKLERKGVVLSGVSQAKLEWKSDGADCKGKLDHLIAENGVIWDLKTSKSASPTAVTAALERHGAYIQHAAYVEGVESLFPDLAGRVRMGFVCCEYVKPYAVTVAYLDGTLAQLGRMQWGRAKELWRRGIESGVWPEYSDDPVIIEAKPWQMTDAIAGSPGVTF